MEQLTTISSLSVKLLRKGWTAASAFSPSFAPGADRQLQALPWRGIEGATLYVGQIYSKTPEWTRFLRDNASNLPSDLFASGAGAAIFLPVEGRVMVVCFGYIHLALNEDAFERQFGLRVSLNTVPRDQLRTLDLATPDAVTFQKRIQASQDSDLQAFGVDMLRDLAQVAGGTPSDPGFARFVAGKDSLSIACRVDINSLSEKCKEILIAYQRKSYQKEFSWVDNMRLVSEGDVIADLDKKLLQALLDLRNGKSSDLHMAPPEIVNYLDGCELHYNGFGSHGKNFVSLSIFDYVAELNRCNFDGSVSDIREKHRIRAQSGIDGDSYEKWHVFDCFVFETTLGKGLATKSYVLFSGRWYIIERKFKEQVEAFYDDIEKIEIVGPTACKNEQQLIEEIESTRADLLKLDRQKINPGGVKYANLEPCDFFSKNKEFIHLKDGNSSGPISHLWAQGVVSAEAFVSDAEFRKKLKAKVKTLGASFEKLLPGANGKFVRGDYKIIYGVMRKPYSDGKLDLPFFSKVSLQAAVERIRQFGFPVAIELIKKPASDDFDDE